ncbi:ABC transporter permease, partial [Mesorhizobium sp. M8A.F.Ca.ET.021.01.1.1]
MSELTHASAPKRLIGGQLLGSSQLVLGVILAVLC